MRMQALRLHFFKGGHISRIDSNLKVVFVVTTHSRANSKISIISGFIFGQLHKRPRCITLRSNLFSAAFQGHLFLPLARPNYRTMPNQDLVQVSETFTCMRNEYPSTVELIK